MSEGTQMILSLVNGAPGKVQSLKLGKVQGFKVGKVHGLKIRKGIRSPIKIHGKPACGKNGEMITCRRMQN